MASFAYDYDKVSAADFVRGFGAWRERASQGPVRITNHGRDTHVLIAAKAFDGMISDECRANTPSVLFETLIDKVEDCFLVVDCDMIVLHANAAACNFVSVAKNRIEGVPLSQALPHATESFAYRGLLKTLSTGQPTSADVPAVTRAGRWLRVETFSVAGGAGVMFRDITGEIESNRAPDVNKAIVEAICAMGTTGYAKISPREMVLGSDPVLRQIVGVSEEALNRVKFSAILAPCSRAAFHEALETVFQHKGPIHLEAGLVSNSGDEIPVRISIAELRGGYASEGAVVVVGRDRRA